MQRLNGGVSGDVMGELLDAVRVRATIFCRSSLGAPWGFAVEPRAKASFHAVTRGKCWLMVAGEPEPRRLLTGDLVVLPHGHEHSLRDRPSSPTLWLEDMLATSPVDASGRLRHGGGGATTEIICGGFVLDGPTDPSPLLRSLPAVVHMRGADARLAPWVAAT